MTGKTMLRLTAALGVMAAIGGCAGGADLGFLKGKTGSGGGQVSTSTRLVERDVEAPNVFQATETGLWDGRPSLGGVWVAHPDATDPERVIIRNEANGKFVIGALFRRERENPGPRLQLSSDAADALGVLAGQPTKLNVTALRKEEVETATPADTATGTAPEQAGTLPAPAPIESATLAPAAGGLAAPLPKVSAPSGPSAEAAPEAAAAPTRPERKSKLSQPYIQIGFYSIEENADRAGAQLRRAGIVPTIRKQTTSGKTFWRVLVGPAATSAERAELLGTIKARGYKDAYFVTD